MEDYIVRATAANETIRAFAVRSTEMTAKARELHYTYPVVTAALGRLLSAGAMMGSMMKGDKDKLTIQMNGDGPIGQLTVTVDSHGNVKGFPAEPSVDIPLKRAGKLDVGGAVGITVSEQTPSAVGLGVMIDTDSSVKEAGGFILQLMPGASEETISALEEKVASAEPVTTMMEKGMTPEDILSYYLDGLDLKILEKQPVRFHCDCSKEKVASALATISKKDLEGLINDGEEIEVKCHFCNSAYKYNIDELKEIMESRDKA